ncbi:DUF1839 family protein [Paeniroseomonas aquatica]|uniref:DUF1839 family protein n=1 Tax=Paeniroseomonas aquatica TaxID=373043 RepID=A0ABT8ABG5_9PROT|nr:DUF1839 family protein [Paeniroseomonas aquatica]MDN3567117.1 DUF1839 family protein [Paeniroseomonas aquatica]
MTAATGQRAPHTWRPHPLHAAARDWPETNCYTDLWISLLHDRGFEPTAMLGFLAAQDWEGDQFTFFKPPPQELRLLYGATLRELAVYEVLEEHVAEALRRGQVVLLEVDAWWLPDVAATAYRRHHTKTTIGILAADPGRRQLRYLHNAGRFTLQGEDYDGILAGGAALFPYAEAAGFLPAGGLTGRELREAAARLLRDQLQGARPARPVQAFAADLPRLLQGLARRDAAALHRFSFNTLRQLGAACELLARHLLWLREGEAVPAAAAALEVSAGAKALQFVLARQLRRGDTTSPAALQGLAETHAAMLDGLRRDFG